MKRLYVLALAVIAGVAALAAVATSGSAQSTGTPRTLTLTERNGTFHFVDNPPRAKFQRGKPAFLSTGDMIVFTNQLYDQANQRRVGTIEASCVAVFGSRSFNKTRFVCDGTARLSNGHLAIHASFRGIGRSGAGIGKSVTGAVTGGTASFDGTSGSYTSVEQPSGKTSKDVFHLVR